MSDNPYTPPLASLEAAPPADRPLAPPAPMKIGGWLILVAIGLIVTPFKIVSVMFANQWPFLRDGHWERLTNADSSDYHPLWAPLIVFEIVGNIGLLVLAAITLALFFKKSKRTPKFAITWYAVGPAFLLLDELLGNLIPAVASNSPASGLTELARATVVAAIWIPYFLVSDRVKKTFTL